MMEWITVVALVCDLRDVVKVVLPWAFVGASLSFIWPASPWPAFDLVVDADLRQAARRRGAGAVHTGAGIRRGRGVVIRRD
jgi:hypothetical protein